MTVISFDTLAYAKKLKLSGISEEQAEAMTNAMSQVLEAKDIATKQDIKALDVALKQDMAVIRQDIKALEASTIVSLSETKVEIIKWMASMMMVQTGIIVGAILTLLKILL